MITDESYLKELRARLLATMRKKAISKFEIARQIGITTVTLANFLNEERKAVNVTAAKIENWLDKQ